MSVNTPFFISPAYWVPRMTISPCSKFRLTLVDEVTPSIVGSAAASPAL